MGKDITMCMTVSINVDWDSPFMLLFIRFYEANLMPLSSRLLHESHRNGQAYLRPLIAWALLSFPIIKMLKLWSVKKGSWHLTDGHFTCCLCGCLFMSSFLGMEVFDLKRSTIIFVIALHTLLSHCWISAWHGQEHLRTTI